MTSAADRLWLTYRKARRKAQQDHENPLPPNQTTPGIRRLRTAALRARRNEAAHREAEARKREARVRRGQQ